MHLRIAHKTLIPIALLAVVILADFGIEHELQAKVSAIAASATEARKEMIEASEVRALSRAIQRDTLKLLNIAWRDDRAKLIGSIGKRGDEQLTRAQRLADMVGPTETEMKSNFVKLQRTVVGALAEVQQVLAGSGEAEGAALFKAKVEPAEKAASKLTDGFIEATAHRIEDMTAEEAAVRASVSAIRLGVLLTSLVGGILIALSIVSRGIVRPLKGIVGRMHALARGDLDTTIEGAGRNDEIGEMASALEVFKTNAIERARAESEAAAERASAEAERERGRAKELQTATERETFAQKEAEQQKHIAEERQALAEQQTLAIEQIDMAITRLAAKDVSYRMVRPLPAEYEPLRANFNAAIEQLASAFERVSETAESVNSGTKEIANAANDLSRRTEQQASSLEESAAALSEISTTAKKTAAGAKEASKSVANARKDTVVGGEVVRRASSAMSRIEESARKITDITTIIDEIAFQTNLLALNAGVEAARAGDAGRGFAVVASEVRALAQRAADAAKQIKALITASSAQVVEGVALVNETGQSLAKIEASVVEIDQIISAIAADANTQATGLGEVNAAIGQMDQMTQQNASMAEQATAASRSLATEGEELSRLVGQFATSSTTDRDLLGDLKKAAPHAFGGHNPTARANDGAEASRPPIRRQSLKRAGGSGMTRESGAFADESWSEF